MPYGEHPRFAVHLVEFADVSCLLWDFDHIIADSLGVRIALLHWFNAYQAVTQPDAVALTPPSSVLDLIERESLYLDSPDYRRDLAHWVARFDPPPPPLLPAPPRHPLDSPFAPTLRRSLPPDLTQALSAAAEAAGTSLQRVVFALFCLSLARRYGHASLACGLALHQRDHKTFNVVGMTASLMPVVFRFEPWWDLTEAVQAFSEDVDADLRHHRAPLDAIQRALGPAPRDRRGLFDVSVSWVPYMGSTHPDHAGYTIGPLDTREAVPIALHAAENPETGAVDYMLRLRPDHALTLDAAFLADAFEALLDRFAEGSTMLVEEIPAIGAREEAWLRQVSRSEPLPSAPLVLSRLSGLVGSRGMRVWCGTGLSLAGRGGAMRRSGRRRGLWRGGWSRRGPAGRGGGAGAVGRGGSSGGDGRALAGGRGGLAARRALPRCAAGVHV